MLPPALHCSVAECKFFRSLLGNCLLRLQKNCTRKGMGRLPLQLLHHQTYTYQEKFRTSKRSKTSQGTVCKYQMSPRCTSLQWAPPGSHIQSDVTISIIFSCMPTYVDLPAQPRDQICRASAARACKFWREFELARPASTLVYS